MKRSTVIRRVVGVAVLSLLTPACLFSMEPGSGGGGGGTENNVTDPCAQVTCERKGELCQPATGTCGVVPCGFTNAADGYQGQCPSDTVCHLNPDGLGYCAPPCGSNMDCIPGVRCEQKYDEVIDGGLCVPDNPDVSCLETQYAGLCLGDEFCDFGDCVSEGSPVCFTRPDEFDAACVIQECVFEGPETDDSFCVLDPGTGGAPALVGVCHYDPTAELGSEFNGFCAEEACGGDFDCVRPGSFCNFDDGRCYPDGGGPDCPPLTFFDPDDQTCKVYLCDEPNSEAGDIQCEERTEFTDVKCSGAFDNGGKGACLFDCREDTEQCGEAPGSVPLVCDEDTGRCVEDGGTEPVCPDTCGFGDVCYEGGCEDSTLGTECAAGSCNGDEACMAPPVGNIPARCVLPCGGDTRCPIGALCGSPNDNLPAPVCATSCQSAGDCPEGFACMTSGTFTSPVCLPRPM
jgi:hypothetical protein